MSRFQYKLAAVCVLSATSVQTSVWIGAIVRGLVLTENMKCTSQHCMLCLSFYISLQYADVHLSCQGVNSLLPTISLQRSAGYVPVPPVSGQSAGAARAAGRQWVQVQGQCSQVRDPVVLQVCQVSAATATGCRTS